jgi:hypothetical protein
VLVLPKGLELLFCPLLFDPGGPPKGLPPVLPLLFGAEGPPKGLAPVLPNGFDAKGDVAFEDVLIADLGGLKLESSGETFVVSVEAPTVGTDVVELACFAS